MFVEAVALQGVECDGGLQYIFEVNEAEQVLSPAHGSLFDESDALEAGVGTEDVWVGRKVRLTSRYEASMLTPST